MEVMVCLAVAGGAFALFAGGTWYLCQDGFPVPARGPWLTLLDLMRLGWCLPVLGVCWAARALGANWRWQPVGCDRCWWLGGLGQTACHDGLFWCPRCKAEV